MITQPSAMLQNHYSMVSALVHQVDEPVYITEKGKEDMVVMSVEAFQRREDLLKLKGLLSGASPFVEYSVAESRADVEKLPYKDELSLNIIIREQAHLDLALLYFICEAVLGEESAKKRMDDIYAAIEGLPQSSSAAPYVPDDELRSMDYQYLEVGPYIIIFNVVKGTVRIFHVFDGRHAYQNLFRH